MKSYNTGLGLWLCTDDYALLHIFKGGSTLFGMNLLNVSSRMPFGMSLLNGLSEILLE